MKESAPPTPAAEGGREHYVLGFAFVAPSDVILIQKRQGDRWHGGKLNGVGGKVEKTDPGYHHAMSREFAEETGIFLDPRGWDWFGSIQGPDVTVILMRAFLPQGTEPRSLTDETVYRLGISECLGRDDLASNLRTLLYAALDPEIKSIALQY